MEKLFIKKIKENYIVCKKMDNVIEPYKKICHISESGHISWYTLNKHDVSDKELFKILNFANKTKKKFEEHLNEMPLNKRYTYLCGKVSELCIDHLNNMRVSLEEKINYLKNIIQNKYVKEEDTNITDIDNHTQFKN